MAKKIIITAVIAGLFFLALYRIFKKEEAPFALFEVARDDVIEELWETGRVQRGEKINLGFSGAGRIEEIYVQTNQEVEKGQILAKLDATELNIQLQAARNSLEGAKLNLEKLLAGATPEEIRIAQAQKENAEISLGIAEKNLKNSYENAITVLDSSYAPIYNALNFVRQFIKDYIIAEDEDGRKIRNAADRIEVQKEMARISLELAKKTDTGSKEIETSLSAMKNALEFVFDELEMIRDITVKSGLFKDRVSATDKASLDALKTSANTALSGVIAAQQTITAMKSSIEAAKISLREAENRLDLVKTGARQVDIDLYETQIKQAQNQTRLYENQIENSVLRSPVKGRVVKINKKVGETTTPQDAVISLLPAVPFEIAADIYEEKIVKLTIGAPVKITLPAFPGKNFTGKVIFIDETEKIINGVVYYEIKIAFDEDPPEGIRPTMTADIVIRADKKENVLVVPRDALKRAEGKNRVEVLANGLFEEREVETGLQSDSLVEIISGLREGEKVVIR